MILGPLVGLTLVLTVATDPSFQSSPTTWGAPGAHLSAGQKAAALRPLVRSATDCVVRKVSVDPRLPDSLSAGNVTELIVDSMATCQEAMRQMIDEHDRLFGPGSGEAFFMGPYLDALPLTVFKLVNDAAH
jgi:hypothetical protein